MVSLTGILVAVTIRTNVMDCWGGAYERGGYVLYTYGSLGLRTWLFLAHGNFFSNIAEFVYGLVPLAQAMAKPVGLILHPPERPELVLGLLWAYPRLILNKVVLRPYSRVIHL